MAANRTGPQIPQFYAGRSIFVTGASGFMGKVLLERLLSTCPDIGRLFLLMRTKRSLTPEDRLHQLKQSQVFDVLRQKNPSQLDKLVIIHGDTSKPGLDISEESRAMLADVSVVFHVAATLRFEEELREAVDQNVRSVIRLMEICDRLPSMQVLVHVSTAYCNTDQSCVEERVYTPPVPVRELLAFVDAAPAHLLGEITHKYIHPKPNTYTFTKAVAEAAVEQHGNRNYSVAIFRPSIVVSSCQNPMPGWIENLNGPSGVIVAGGKGLLHVFSTRPSARADFVPVDMAIDTLIAAAWETGVDRSPDVKVYNCSSYDNPITWGYFESLLKKHLRKHPMDNIMWYPCGTSVENVYMEKILQLLLQTVPLYVMEFAKRLFGVKSKISLITVEQRLRAMSSVLRFFSMREWKFQTENVKKLNQRLSSEDRKIYNLDPCTIKWDDHIKDFVIGSRRYILKEQDKDMLEAKRHLKRMTLLHNCLIFVTVLVFLRAVLQNSFIRDFIISGVKFLTSLFYTSVSKFVSTP